MSRVLKEMNIGCTTHIQTHVQTMVSQFKRILPNVQTGNPRSEI